MFIIHTNFLLFFAIYIFFSYIDSAFRCKLHYSQYCQLCTFWVYLTAILAKLCTDKILNICNQQIYYLNICLFALTVCISGFAPFTFALLCLAVSFVRLHFCVVELSKSFYFQSFYPISSLLFILKQFVTFTFSILSALQPLFLILTVNFIKIYSVHSTVSCVHLGCNQL